MKFLLDHTILGFCWLDLIALVVLVCVFFYVRSKMKDLKAEKEALEGQLAGTDAAAAVSEASAAESAAAAKE